MKQRGLKFLFIVHSLANRSGTVGRNPRLGLIFQELFQPESRPPLRQLPTTIGGVTLATMKNVSEILHYLLDRSRKMKTLDEGPLLAVFDLDSTLFDVSPRTQAILHDLAAHPKTQEKFPEEARQLAGVRSLPKDWGIRVALERSKIRATLDFFETVRTFWVENFFGNDYLHHDRLYDGALEFVQQLYEAGARIIYLTGRDQERMGDGTLRILKSWNLPLDDEERHLILKPHRSIEDARYKTDKLIELNTRYPEVWFFENEPVIIDLVRREAPQIKIVFVDTTHSGRSSAPEDLPAIRGKFK
ncbi:MAG: HAD family hydrolase [Bdellovibrionaceae bacterium]|nr:HAD family hydrolase [Pseudobdellovibrionaceae bacterium]